MCSSSCTSYCSKVGVIRSSKRLRSHGRLKVRWQPVSTRCAVCLGRGCDLPCILAIRACLSMTNDMKFGPLSPSSSIGQITRFYLAKVVLVCVICTGTVHHTYYRRYCIFLKKHPVGGSVVGPGRRKNMNRTNHIVRAKAKINSKPFEP